MGSTPNYSWQYPALTDPPNVPQHMQALADAADTTVKGIDTRLTAAENKIIAIEKPPHATLSKGPGPAVPNNTPTFVPWDLKYADTAGGYDPADNTRYTVQHAGRHLVAVTLAGTISAAGHVQILFVRNGTAKAWAAAASSNAGQFALNGVHLPWMNIGEYIQIQVYQTTGQPLQLYPNTNDNGGCLLEITWLGDT